jgi:hypothetical protein
MVMYLLLWGNGQHPPNKHPVGDKFEPRVREAWSLGGPQNVQRVAERCEDLVVDGLEDRFGRVELQEEHNEDAVIRQLLELCEAIVMVL